MIRVLVVVSAAFMSLSCGTGTIDPPSVVFDPDVVIPTDSRADAGVTVTIATWNVEDFGNQSGTLAGTYMGVATVLDNASIDVAAFEEGQPEDIAPLSEALSARGYSMPYLACSSLSDGYNGLAVASKYAISGAEEILPKASGNWPRSLYKVKIDIGRGLTLFVCHLKSGSDAGALGQRRAQAQALAAYLREVYASSLDSASLVILGDMNTMSAGDRDGAPSTLDFLESRDDADAANDFRSMTESLLSIEEAYTWEGSVSGTWTRSALDHIVLSPNAQIRYIPGSLEILRVDPSVAISANSDHYPVVLDISL